MSIWTGIGVFNVIAFEYMKLVHLSSSNRSSTTLHFEYPLVAQQPFISIIYKVRTYHERADFIDYSIYQT